MKIFIRTLLPAILVLIHIHELNASSGHNEGGSSRPYRYPPEEKTSQSRQSETPPQQLQHPQQNPRGPGQRHTLLFRDPQLELEQERQHQPQHPQQNPQGPNQRHTLIFREPQLEQELHQQQPIQSDTPRSGQRKRPLQQQQQQLERPQLQQNIRQLQLRQQQVDGDIHHLPQPIQQQQLPQDPHRLYALERRRKELEQELRQVLQPIQSETPQSRQRQRTQQEEQEEQQEEQERQRRDLQQLQQKYPLADIRITEQPIIFKCFDKQIKASVAYLNGIRKTYACELMVEPFFHPFIPDMNYRKSHIFATVECSINNVRCVAYVDEHGKVFGVKPPEIPVNRQRPGDPVNQNPTASTSFINRFDNVFEVTQDPQTKIVERIELLPRNTLMSDNDGKNNVFLIQNVQCCGMVFSAHKRKNYHIVGAELNKKEGPQSLYNPRYM